jgi:hypothetical protein
MLHCLRTECGEGSPLATLADTKLGHTTRPFIVFVYTKVHATASSDADPSTVAQIWC